MLIAPKIGNWKASKHPLAVILYHYVKGMWLEDQCHHGRCTWPPHARWASFATLAQQFPRAFCATCLTQHQGGPLTKMHNPTWLQESGFLKDL